MKILGIDVGGTGIKGAIVNTASGRLITERIRIKTPEKSTPAAVSKVIKELIRQIQWQGPVGCGFPAIIQNGVARSAANIHKSWIDTDVAALIRKITGDTVAVLNDADAAGLAEMKFGAGKGCHATVLMITIGTGLGSALFYDGRLIPNIELGHLLIKNKIAEHYASETVRIEEKLSWKKWAKRFNKYLEHVERLFSPDLIILGGGVSKEHEKFLSYLSAKARIVPAQLRNEAGIIGAALAARLAMPKMKTQKANDEKPTS